MSALQSRAADREPFKLDNKRSRHSRYFVSQLRCDLGHDPSIEPGSSATKL